MKQILFSAILLFAFSNAFSQQANNLISNNVSDDLNLLTQDFESDGKENTTFFPYHSKHGFHRVTLRIGGGPYYHFGIMEFPKGISFNHISFQGEAMIGYNFKNDHWPVHTAGLFARRGIANSYISRTIIFDQELPDFDFDDDENFNFYREYEVGLLIGRWFRMSGGFGSQLMYEMNGRRMIFNYYTFTSGFCFGSRHVRWSFYGTAAGGNDYQNLHFKFYTGINFYLNLLKI
jgi:hypothetical protein